MNSKAYKVVVTATNGRPMVIAFPSGHYAGLGSSGLLLWKGDRGIEIPLPKRKTIKKLRKEPKTKGWKLRRKDDVFVILNDKQIIEYCEQGMITPFLREKVSHGVISYGLSSYGYDIRIAKKFKVFTNVYSTVVDPKNFDPQAMVDVVSEDSVLIPPNSFALGMSIEYFQMPADVIGICIGKSTYARAGIIVNITPLEPAWTGFLTIEISNTTPLPAKIYVGEGIAQVIFLRGEPCLRTYAGKYQNQEDIVPARV